MERVEFWEKTFPFKPVWDYLDGSRCKYAFRGKKDSWHRNDKTSIPLQFKTLHEFQVYFKRHPDTTTFFVSGSRFFFFEVDITDYLAESSANRPPNTPSATRSCACQATNQCCDMCWVEVLRAPLIACLDYCVRIHRLKQVVSLFSGRRGFWILIGDTLDWDDEARRSFLNRVPAYIDRGVSEQRDHLMKVPFTPHHETGRLAVPIIDAHTFVPSQSETICREMIEKIKY